MLGLPVVLIAVAVMAWNNSVPRFPTRKMYSVSLKVLKQQFSKMADAGDIEVSERSSLTPANARKFWNFLPQWFKIDVFLRQK